jgi:hypothetical protein
VRSGGTGIYMSARGPGALSATAPCVALPPAIHGGRRVDLDSHVPARRRRCARMCAWRRRDLQGWSNAAPRRMRKCREVHGRTRAAESSRFGHSSLRAAFAHPCAAPECAERRTRRDASTPVPRINACLVSMDTESRQHWESPTRAVQHSRYSPQSDEPCVSVTAPTMLAPGFLPHVSPFQPDARAATAAALA